jgi:N-acetyl-anhydromuramyl-L-alanine amidase AmpD
MKAMIPPKLIPEVIQVTMADTHLDRSAPGAIPFVQAHFFTKSNRMAKHIDLVVLHSMEGIEDANKAESVAIWFAGKNKRFEPPRASAHYAVDCDSIVQMVKDKDVAWHAPGANHNGIGIEHAGKAKQTREEWFDEFSAPMLLISAGLIARLCKRYGIPVEFVDAKGLHLRKSGITTHREVTSAFHRSTHMDPGANFPLDWYIEQVRFAYAKV